MDKRIAREVDGVDIVVGGHTNTFLYTGKPPSTEIPYGPYPLVITPESNPESKVLVVQAFARGKYLGHLKAEFDDSGHVTSWSGNPILLNSSVQKDPEVLRQVNAMKGKVARVSEVKVGSSFVFLNGSGCMFKECNLGNVVTDAFVFHYANQTASDAQWTDASIAIQNSGSITSSIAVSAQDNVTYGHIANILPFKNLVTVDLVELKGEDLVQVFEQVASLYDENKPSESFLQVSGLQIQYDMKKPSGNRVVEIQVRCAVCQVPVYKPLNKSAVYKVILPSSLARGGAGLSVIAEKKRSHQVGHVTDDVAVVDYFMAKSPIMTGVEKRITFVHSDDESSVICGSTGIPKALNMLLVLAVLALAVEE